MMPPESEKHGCQSVPIDRLSNLPENVTNSILMRLSLRRAVRTSILSKKWRYKWCKLPQLTIDYTLCYQTNDSLSPTIKFTKIMYQILTLHSGPLTKFTLFASELRKYSKIGSLIYFLSRNDIQDLVLEFSRWNRYRLPPPFFTLSQLKHLTLRNCVICFPPAFKGFDRLNSLNLRDVTISSELLESLISHSPLLEKLVLEISDTSNTIHINAPNLTSLELRDCIKYYSSSNVPRLSKLSLSYQRSLKESEKCDLDKFFQLFPAFEHLDLESGTVQFLVTGASEVPRRLSSPLNCLKRLNIYVRGLADVSFTLCLIRSSPYIQDIEMEYKLEYEYSCKPEASNEVNEVLASFSDVTLNHLKTVQLKEVRGTQLELQLIKLLLTISPILVRMLIYPSGFGSMYDETRDKILAATTVQRSSSKAEVVVLNEYECYGDIWENNRQDTSTVNKTSAGI